MLNPILIKEFRLQTREWKYALVGIIYLLIISGLAFGMIWSASTGKEAPDPEYGRGILRVFFIILTLAICTICPAFTVNSVSSEKEQRRFDLIRLTLLKPSHIIVGKVIPIFAYILILLLASLPVVLLLMPIGRITLSQVSICYLISFVSAMTFGMVGLVCSSFITRTRVAVAVAYAVIGILAIVTMLVPLILDKIFLIDVSSTLSDISMILTPFFPIAVVFSKAPDASKIFGLPLWFLNTAIYLILSVILTVLIFVKLKADRA